MRVVIVSTSRPGVDPVDESDRAALTRAGHVVEIVRAPVLTGLTRLRFGPVRVDPGRWAAAAVLLANPAARSNLRAADVVVAADATALPTVWLLGRWRRGGPLCLDGVRGAVTRLTS